jgi:hypothetical protein
MDNSQPLEENDVGMRAFATLAQFLDEDGWYPQQLGDNQVYRVAFAGDNAQFTCYAQVRVDLLQFFFYAIAPLKVPSESRDAVAEFITRANYGMRIGNFELDYDDGEVRYKSSLDFEGAELTPELIARAIYPAVGTMDRYAPGLMSVVYGDQTPVEAIAAIEGE